MSKFSDLVSKRLDEIRSQSETEGWIILYKGKQLIMPSGKRVWPSKRNATCALSNAMYGVTSEAYHMGLKPEERDYGVAYKELGEQGLLEFKKLS